VRGVELTFEDGPDPARTPAMGVLRERGLADIAASSGRAGR